MASPNWLVEIKLDGSFVIVTADVRAIAIDTGRQRSIDTFTAGRCRISLNNQDSKYGPLTGGTYSDSQWINAEVRVSVGFNSASTYTPLFRGQVDDVDVTYPNARESVLIVKASDGLAVLSRTELVDELDGVTGNATFAEQVGSARFTAVLDNAQVAYPSTSSPLAREVETSTITMAAETVAQLSTTTYLAKLAQSEAGAIYCRHGIPAGGAATSANRGNVLTYKNRSASSSATGLTFGGSSTTTATPPFVRLSTSYGAELLYTRGVYAGSTGNDMEYEENVIGIPAYGIRTIVRRNLLNLNDSDVKEAASTFVALHSSPVLRVTGMTCMPRAMTEAQAEKVTKIGVWDGFSVRFRPAGASTDMLETVRCEGVKHDITPGNWTMTVATSGTGASQFFILDSEYDGLLDNNKLAP